MPPSPAGTKYGLVTSPEKRGAAFRPRPLLKSDLTEDQRSSTASIAAPTSSIAAMPSTRVTMPRAS